MTDEELVKLIREGERDNLPLLRFRWRGYARPTPERISRAPRRRACISGVPEHYVFRLPYGWYKHVRPHTYNGGTTPYAARVA